MSQHSNSDPLEEARLLLPWYITGKLTEPESALVQHMLEQHPILQAEYERELLVVNLIRENHSLLRLTAVDTTSQRLDKLMKRIERDTTSTLVSAMPEPPPRPASKVDKPSWWERLKQLFPSGKRFAPAYVGFAALLAVQIGLLAWYSSAVSNNPFNHTQATYQVATADNGTASADSAVKLLVEFDDAASFAQVKNFLERWHLRVIEGPARDNTVFFRLEVIDQNLSNQQLDAMVQQMQQEQGIINFAGKNTL